MGSKKGKLENNLYLLRAEQRWSQKYVAEMLGVSRQTIHSLESNKYNPSLMLAFQIAKLFEVEITDIFQYLEEES
ncbi:transcriptional regulator [Bacillus pseudomycoides]|uniref:Transcriptional regulator n=1 Tax=Bacillus pseudomycoides TaxID=64104 RepID=A0AA91VE99_9BACI|nr:MULTISPECIES: helix-turn-helix transcriptional regulator [Bacillus]PEB51718.1 transcriptional regulator [Bacillus sp. AFS098217]PED83686.1 transcriptional regulator [Bacillus pseudomycoides]PEU12326.1 transcriptional regulator [Bacillus sp. AFS019443]PEU21686.1 transcriptional regulator [Bacillus sp. AFS014408]PFW62047.1 transcriptional regulator [Bacillus sp. AFS075034]